MHHKALTYFKGTTPLTSKDVQEQKKRKQKRIEEANRIKDICLNCTKPAKKCNGNCEHFKDSK